VAGLDGSRVADGEGLSQRARDVLTAAREPIFNSRDKIPPFPRPPERTIQRFRNEVF
jgi:hypothetical protein